MEPCRRSGFLARPRHLFSLLWSSVNGGEWRSSDGIGDYRRRTYARRRVARCCEEQGQTGDADGDYYCARLGEYAVQLVNMWTLFRWMPVAKVGLRGYQWRPEKRRRQQQRHKGSADASCLTSSLFPLTAL